MSDSDGPPQLPHLSSEFFVWLWFAAEREGGSMFFGEEIGVLDFWIEERLSFRSPDEDRPRAVMTGEDAATSLEARAALAGGKVVRDVQLHLRREEREYTVVLRGAGLDLSGLKFPTHATDGEDELLYERMYLYEDVWFIIRALYQRFATERTAAEWASRTLPAMRRWVAGGPAESSDGSGSDQEA